MNDNQELVFKLEARLLPEHPLFDIIQKAYKVFECAIPQNDGACDCCMSPEIKADFFNYGQRDLPFQYLTEWYGAAVDPNLDKEIWMFLLPRILEALASGEEVSYCGNEVVLYRFQTGDHQNWTPKQWDVLDEFQQLFLVNFLRQYDCNFKGILDDRIDSIICMFALAGWPLDDLHAQIMALPNETLAKIFYHDWKARNDYWYTNNDLGTIRITGFWKKDQKNNMLAFYTSKILYDRMVALCELKEAEDDIFDKALFVADTIHNSRSWCN